MNNKRYIVGIFFLGSVIVISWLVSALGREKYTTVDMTTTTAYSENSLGTTTQNGDISESIETATSTDTE